MQECVREDLELKREVFAAIDAAAPADALICSSSSGLSISDIQTAASRPERCLAAHPYNPPHLVPLVELAPGRADVAGGDGPRRGLLHERRKGAGQADA